eukprot:m.92973 g.92973  ORF g.92973 m.92973 type:complete len:62 (+) comp14682_c1_seq1:115-300(+)
MKETSQQQKKHRQDKGEQSTIQWKNVEVIYCGRIKQGEASCRVVDYKHRPSTDISQQRGKV